MIESVEKFHTFKGFSVAKECLESMDDILVYFDPDVDGTVAGYLVCRYCRLNGKRFQWYINSGRQHDWSIPLDKCKGRNIIAVDFKIPQNTIKDLVGVGCSIVSMDHHVNSKDLIYYKGANNVGIVLNNQYSSEPDDGRYLSGSGVVFETLRQIDPRMDTEDNRALVGLTLLSDICDIENPYAAMYLKTLYEHKNEGYIKYLITNTIGTRDFNFGSPRMDRNYVDFKFSPAINSNLRFGKQDEVVKFFLGSGKLDLSCHQRQKDLVQEIQKVVTVKEFSHLRVVYFKDWEVQCKEDKSLLSSFIGLVASKYLDGVHSVVCYDISMSEKGKPFVKRASFRGNNSSVDYLTSWKKFVDAEGHPPAFGIKKLIPSKELFISLNDACKELESNSTRTVKIKPVINMSLFANTSAKDMAEKNMYCLSRHRSYVRYTGKNISVLREGANYREFSVDGISIMCFDLNLDFSNALIFPILERGYIKFYLQSEM